MRKRPASRLVRLSAIILGVLTLAMGASAPAAAQTTAPDAPATCRIGVNVEDVYDLDMARDAFSAILWVWSLCPSAELNPLDVIAFPTASSLNLGPVTSIDVGGADHYTYRRVQGSFRHHWNMDHYPFDRQHVVIPMDETFYGAARVIFEPDAANSFLTPDIRERLREWRISDLALTTGISEEDSTYGLPGAVGARYARVEAALAFQRVHFLTFFKLTAGVFAGVFIAFLSFFYDPTDRGAFGGKLGLLVGVLFAVLLNLRAVDTSIGDTWQLTLVTEIHLLTLLLVVILACIALRDRRRADRNLPVRHPDWPLLAVVGGVYLLVVAGLMANAAWSH